MKQRLLLTGAAGFVGGNIIREAGAAWEIHGVDRVAVEGGPAHVSWHNVDLLDANAVRELFATVRPSAVVHTAAMSDIDYCEANPETALRINVGVTELLVDLCREFDSKIVYFSSDSVFDGERGLYREDETPIPVNEYGRTKVQAEHVVMNRSPNWVIVRPSLVMGLPVGDIGNSFLWRMIGDLKKGEQVAFPESEIRSPVDVITLSRAVLELAERTICGHFHLSGNDGMTRFEMARRICEKLGYPSNRVVDKKPAIATGRAKRPPNVTLANVKAKLLLHTPMAGLDSGLNLIIEKKEDKEL
ncbi:MAG TPA: SDR family oxidoreductase [Spirochaetia bacterium]|nr:SDR family oxidoreductase [Spirochaetia bacterium]